MKPLLPFSLVLVMALVVPHGAYAKKKGKGEHEEPAPATPAPVDPSNPAQALSPYIINLDQLLALNRPPNLASQSMFTQTSGLLLTLRQQFVGAQESAPAEGKTKFTAAINTCDLITAALEERGKTVGDLNSSAAVAGSGKTEEQARKDNLAEGIHAHGYWGGYSKAVGERVEERREQAANAQSQARAAGNDNALTAMAANQWNQRAIAWHQKIAASYSQIK